MVEELKLAIKIDDASIEQSLLKQFANAQKMADKVVLDFRNVNFDDKQIEAKFKEMQKKAGQNPINLTISDNALDMLGQIDKRLTEIFSIGKGKSFIDSSSITTDIGKIENKIIELNKKYEETQKKLSSIGSGNISGKDVNLVDNAEFQKLTKDVEKTKTEINVLKENITSLFEGMNNDERVVDRMDEDFQNMSLTVNDLIDKIHSLQEELQIISSIPSHESNISLGNKIDEAVTSAKDLDKTLNQVNIPTDSFDKVLEKLDRTKSELIDIVKITKKSVSDAEGKFHDAYTLKDSRGSTEIYGVNSKTDKGQILHQNIVDYDANSQLRQEQQETKRLIEENIRLNKNYYDSKAKDEAEYQKLRAKYIAEGLRQEQQVYQEYNKSWDEAIKYNDSLDDSLKNTESILNGLSTPKTLEEDFLKLIDDSATLEHQLKNCEITLKEYNSLINSKVRDYNEKVDIQQKRDVEEYNAAANTRKTKTNQFKKIDDKFSKYSKQYTSLENSPAGYQHNDKYKAALEAYDNQLKAIKIKIQAIQDQDIDVVDQKDLFELDKMYTKLDKINDSLSHIPATQKGSTQESRQKVFNMINELKQFTGMARESKLELEAMEQRFKNLGTNLNVSEAISEVKAFKSQLVATNQTTKNLLDTVKEKAWYGWAAQLAGMFSFYDVINGFRQVTSTVIDLNTQITELAKVSEQSSKQIYDDFSSYADIAKEVRGTISDTIAATSDWSKNGYSIPDSKQLAEVSQLYKNVGDGIDINAANESLISTLKGFKLEADQAEHIVDVFNEVSNNEAISSGGIGDALQRSAASFNAASTSLEKSVSLVTATNSVLQDPEKVGNMWRTVAARLRGSETELKEMGADTDGLVTSTSKLQALVKGITGFDIMKDKDTYKDIYDIVLGIGEKWQDLSDIDRASLLEALAGKQQSNALAAALNNIDVLKKSYGEAMNAQGSAREENEEYAKSIQASIDLTKAKLEELSADLLSSDFLKGAIDAGGKFIDVLDGIVKSGSAIPAVATAISAALSFKNVGRVKIVALM